MRVAVFNRFAATARFSRRTVSQLEPRVAVRLSSNEGSSNNTGENGAPLSQSTLPQLRSVVLPDIESDGATVLKYLKKEGDLVAKDEEIVDLDYGEFVMGLQEKDGGVLAKIVAPPGASVDVGEKLYFMLNDETELEAWKKSGQEMK